MNPGMRRLYVPWPVEVQVDTEGIPLAVDGVGVAGVREEWLVEDRWWTLRRLWRHYFELAMVDGSNVVVFRNSKGRWYRQRG
jgi:hypothetical protein